MKDEEMNIKIAEACGWTDVSINSISRLTQGFPPAGWTPPYGTYENGKAQIPDYCNRLDWMHEAVISLSYENSQEWVNNLGQVLGCKNPNDWSVYDMVTATARQRAEAFLRTIGKWED